MDPSSYPSIYVRRSQEGGEDERESTSLLGRKKGRFSLGRVLRRLLSRGKRKRSVYSRLIHKVVWGALKNARRKSSSSRFVMGLINRKDDCCVSGYDVTSYSENFDDGRWQQEEVEFGRRSFAFRFGQPSGFQESSQI